jgi:hypothetical protein
MAATSAELSPPFQSQPDYSYGLVDSKYSYIPTPNNSYGSIKSCLSAGDLPAEIGAALKWYASHGDIPYDSSKTHDDYDNPVPHSYMVHNMVSRNEDLKVENARLQQELEYEKIKAAVPIPQLPPGLLQHPPGVLLADTSPKAQARNGPATIQLTEEEQWRDRRRKRQEAVDNMKHSDAYRRNQDEYVDAVIGRPCTPDPEEKLSKREWENRVAKWRCDWREIDGVRSLVDAGFSEARSRKAWKSTKKSTTDPQTQEQHLQQAIEKLNGFKWET